jgi:hypothetical protein
LDEGTNIYSAAFVVDGAAGQSYPGATQTVQAYFQRYKTVQQGLCFFHLTDMFFIFA